jgi:cytochrome c553
MFAMNQLNMLGRSVVMGALVAGVSSAALAADVVKGKEKADAVCAACHGKDGNTPIDPGYPRLAGQYRDFLERALLDYQGEHRKNAIMVAQAKQLSRKDVENLAAYYASLPGQMTLKKQR